jgi:futalosine hydrolase
MYIIITIIGCKYTKQKWASCFILASMKILVVAATREEIGLLIDSCQLPVLSLQENSQTTINSPQTPQILLTGVGMVATAFALGRHLATHQYDMAINLGIAGSFDRNIPLGTVVEVTEDNFTELGAEDDNSFISLDALGFGQTKFTATAKLADYYTNVRPWQVNAATVNTVHGEETSIAKLLQRAAPQLESMEGAAFFYACQQAGVPAMQIRAVSNYVEKRNRDAWNIGLAVKNLNTFAVELLSVIS